MQKKDSVIYVNMLGEFSIRFGNRIITQNKGRTKQVWMLIEYLIANRKKDVSIDKIIEVLWPEDDCSDPLNALKNLVYRARKLLKGLSGGDIEYITFNRNTYAWNNSLQCEIDTEQLEALWKDASNENMSVQERIQKYLDAIRYYKGEFLPKSSVMSWVVSANANYSTVYNECVIKVCALLMTENRFDDIILICENALNYSLFEEEIHKALLRAYTAAHKYEKALAHYNYVDDLFLKEFSVGVSESFVDIYRQIKGRMASTELDLTVIKNDLGEAGNKEGAFYCDYDVFKDLYKVQARSISRTGQQVFIVLFTVCDREGNLINREEKEAALEILKNSIVGSLRKGDIVSAYSGLQFIAMLPLITYENAQMVGKRIQKTFQMHYSKNDVQILTKINPIDSGDT